MAHQFKYHVLNQIHGVFIMASLFHQNLNIYVLHVYKLCELYWIQRVKNRHMEAWGDNYTKYCIWYHLLFGITQCMFIYCIFYQNMSNLFLSLKSQLAPRSQRKLFVIYFHIITQVLPHIATLIARKCGCALQPPKFKSKCAQRASIQPLKHMSKCS